MSTRAPVGRAEAETGARAAYARWFAALEAGDVAGALAALTADVVHRGPSGETRIGRDAVGAALAAFLRDHTERVRWSLTLVDAPEGEAHVRVREEATIRARAGGPTLCAAGWHTGRVRREADGVWRIAEDASALDGPPTVCAPEPDAV